VKAWTLDFPLEIQNVITATEGIASWLSSSVTITAEPGVFCTHPSGPSLWEQIRLLFVKRVRRIFVVSPYFDSKFAFLRTLAKDLNPKECVIAVHPDFTEMSPPDTTLLKQWRFIDVSQIGEQWARDRLHAKIYKFEFADGTALVMSGSANASSAAWLAPPGKRNAEMMLIHRNGEEIWKKLGLSEIARLPDVGEEGWKAIQLRVGQREQIDATCEMPFLATTATVSAGLKGSQSGRFEGGPGGRQVAPRHTAAPTA
jgi:hypothetical protein